MSRRRPSPLWLALALVLLGGLLAGCSTEDGDPTASDAPTEPSAGDGEPGAQQRRTGPLERYAGFTSETYDDLVAWLCHPDADDVCDSGQDATLVEADGTLTVEPWSPADEPPVDCFYVYPTVSRDPGDNSDMEPADGEERFAAANQVARLSEHCRVFAPVYRQRTLAGLVRALGPSSPVPTEGRADSGGADDRATEGTSPNEIAFGDVLEAWKHYMANDNGGRGVVLVGHSQGASMLGQLIASEIDPDEDVRDVLVAAYLAGWSVVVPTGEDVGGDFDEVPLCRDEDQVGCVVTWASYRATSPPPPDALFGRPSRGDGVTACNNPAALAGGSAELRSYFPAEPRASVLAALGARGDRSPWLDPAVGTVGTPFVATPGLVSGECVERDGFNYLEITLHGDPSDPRVDDIEGDLTPQWGLHLQDVTLVMGDISALVGSQSAAWRASHD